MTGPRPILIATRNASKGREMEEILAGGGLRVVTLLDLDPDGAEVDESGSTYAENATLKARAAADRHGLIALGDDAGFEVDFLDGAPGLYSRRFCGEETSFPDKMRHILELMRDAPDAKRGCRFQCAVAIAIPGGDSHLCEGALVGTVGREMRGSHGFGYDPIFVLPDGRHLAELTPDEKHRISHRGQALERAHRVLQDLLGES